MNPCRKSSRRIIGQAPVFNPKYLEFANHYGFTTSTLQNLLREIGFARALPEVPFFRHGKTIGIKEWEPFSRKMFNKWWLRACTDLGVEGATIIPWDQALNCNGPGAVA